MANVYSISITYDGTIGLFATAEDENEIKTGLTEFLKQLKNPVVQSIEYVSTTEEFEEKQKLLNAPAASETNQ